MREETKGISSHAACKFKELIKDEDFFDADIIEACHKVKSSLIEKFPSLENEELYQAIISGYVFYRNEYFDEDTVLYSANVENLKEVFAFANSFNKYERIYEYTINADGIIHYFPGFFGDSYFTSLPHDGAKEIDLTLTLKESLELFEIEDLKKLRVVLKDMLDILDKEESEQLKKAIQPQTQLSN